MAGVVGLGGSVEGNVTYHFNYQATDSFSINLNYSFESAPTEASATMTAEDLNGSITSASRSIGQSGSASFSLSPSTFKYVKIEASGTGGGTLTTSLS